MAGKRSGAGGVGELERAAVTTVLSVSVGLGILVAVPTGGLKSHM